MAKQEVIPIKKNSRAPAEFQAYQKLYWEEKLKVVVDEEYAQHLHDVEATKDKDDNEKVILQKKIKVQTDVVINLYAKEADQVKERVKNYIENLKEPLKNEEEQDRVKRYQQWVNSRNQY